MLHGYICNHVIQNMQMKMNQMMNFAKVNLKNPESYQFLKSENRYIMDTLENHDKYYCLVDKIRYVNTEVTEWIKIKNNISKTEG